MVSDSSDLFVILIGKYIIYQQAHNQITDMRDLFISMSYDYSCYDGIRRFV